MNSKQFKRIAELWAEVLEKKTLDPVNPKAVKKKFDDRKDKDIDNDGDVDSSDEYLHKRRKAIAKNEAMDEMQDCPDCDGSMENHEPDCPRAQKSDKKKLEDDKDLDADNSRKALKHDCATHVASEQWGFGECISGQHTLEEQADGTGIVTHYDIMFEHGIEMNVPIEELTIVAEKQHMHASTKAMGKPPFEPTPKSKLTKTDRFGNKIKDKNRAKHLAKKAMRGEAVDEAKQPDHAQKGKGEKMLDKFKGKGAKDMAKDNNIENPKHADITPEEEGHNDASKAGRVTKQSKGRNGDNLTVGDKTPPKGGK